MPLSFDYYNNIRIFFTVKPLYGSDGDSNNDDIFVEEPGVTKTVAVRPTVIPAVYVYKLIHMFVNSAAGVRYEFRFYAISA